VQVSDDVTLLNDVIPSTGLLDESLPDMSDDVVETEIEEDMAA